MNLLQVRGLTKRFGGLVATDSVDLAVAAGEIHAIIGPNGAGKTTLISQLSGAQRPDAGSIVLRGVDITRLSAHERVRRGIARSFQVTNVFRAMTAVDNVALALQAGDGTSFRFWRRVTAERHLFDAAHDLLARVRLHERAAVLAGELAHGEQRQLEVALALATRPALLLLDEPMAGMGPEESARMVDLIDSLRRDLTIVLVEHDVDAVFRLADRISVLVYGRLLATGDADAIRANEDVRRAYLGADAS
ncbi:MAG TPA: ABC transporter ATP-binding protein [Burkholderiaceae bacterium]|nr:ABC transporter ATP-binding protein [Burkholderiaceae bacterium]HQR71113.1 ABC transporter ATP-binding protein [Burkholderiaceae bacterium]